jgi:hypothetical protein
MKLELWSILRAEQDKDIAQINKLIQRFNDLIDEVSCSQIAQ